MRFVFLGCLLILFGCKKDKTDFSYNGQPTQSAITSSPIRIVNINSRGLREMVVNGQRLTSFIAPDPRVPITDRTKGTKYFPENGRMGTTWYLPQELINPDGKARVQMGYVVEGSTELNEPVSWEVDEHAFPFPDYYNIGATADDSVFVLPRSVSPPANPQHFKIRLLNLSSPGDLAGLEGPMSLSWADGSLLSEQTNAIAPGHYSEYIELPYGSYQFKVLDPAGRPLPAQGGAVEGLQFINPSTGTSLITDAGGPDSRLTYAPLRSYQPGGIYTIVVSNNAGFRYTPPGSQFDEPVFLNSFRIISDISDPLNVTYARIQAVNAMPGKEITVQVDGGALPGMPLAYTAYGDYGRFIIGKHQVKALDKQGNVMAEQEISLNGSDNFSVWVYADSNGKPAITMVANNLSSAFYVDDNNGEDGTNSHRKVLFPKWLRFLNLCPDLPEVTFTAANGQLFTSAAQHLLFGKPVAEQPYLMLPGTAGPDVIYAYASTPGILPGNWIREIPVLNGPAFIARPEWYPAGRLPESESGVYTVALVGSNDPAAPAGQRARMIIVKHNK